MKVSSITKFSGTRLSDRIRTARRAASFLKLGLPSAWELRQGPWRSGKTPPMGTKPGVERLEAIAAATGAVFDWLATGRGDQRRRKTHADSTPALNLDDFAHDIAEEVLLDRFRRLSPQARTLLSSFLDAITTRRR